MCVLQVELPYRDAADAEEQDAAEAMDVDGDEAEEATQAGGSKKGKGERSSVLVGWGVAAAASCVHALASATVAENVQTHLVRAVMCHRWSAQGGSLRCCCGSTLHRWKATSNSWQWQRCCCLLYGQRLTVHALFCVAVVQCWTLRGCLSRTGTPPARSSGRQSTSASRR